jgi:MscS family membrane protein
MFGVQDAARRRQQPRKVGNRAGEVKQNFHGGWDCGERTFALVVGGGSRFHLAGMKLKFTSVFQAAVLALAVLLVWAVWASAQTSTLPASANAGAGTGTAAAAGSTNQPLFSAMDFADADTAAATGSTNLASATWLTFGLDRVEALQPMLLGRPRWQFVASLLYIALAFLVARLIDVVICGWLKKIAAKTDTQLDDLLLELVSGPVKVVAFVMLLHLGLRIFSWPPWVEDWLSKGLSIVVALSLTYLAVKCVDLAMAHWRRRAKEGADPAFDEVLFSVMRKLLKGFVLVVAVLLTTHNLGLNITSLLASLSLGGLVLGFAAQDTLANLFGAVAVYVDKPFRVGDRIQLDKVDGTVEQIGLRSTRVRSLDGYLVTIPNKTMGSATITNISRRPSIKSESNFSLTYDLPSSKVARAVALLEEIYRADPRTADVTVSFNKFTDFALNIQVVHFWGGDDLKAHAAAMQALNLAVKARFDAEGIAFAYPTQTLVMKHDAAARA